MLDSVAAAFSRLSSFLCRLGAMERVVIGGKLGTQAACRDIKQI
jgi:hypothetical protein